VIEGRFEWGSGKKGGEADVQRRIWARNPVKCNWNSPEICIMADI
jgi:hypothetical protein